MRAQGEARTIVSLSRNDTLAVGFSRAHEEDKNTYFTDADFNIFPMPRDETAVYVENRWALGGRLFLNAGVRGEWIRTAAIPADGYSHPVFPATTVARAQSQAGGSVRGAPGGPRGVGVHAAARVVGHGHAAAHGIRAGVHHQPATQTGTDAQPGRGSGAATAGRQAVAGRHVFLQPLLRPDRGPGRSACGTGPLHDREPGQFAGTGRGVFGAAAARAVAVRDGVVHAAA